MNRLSKHVAPIPPTWLWGMALIVGALTFFAQFSAHHDFIVRWAEVATVWRRAGVLPTAFASACAAAIGQWRHTIAASRPNALTGHQFAAAHLIPVLAVTTPAFVLSALPAWIVAWNRASGPGPDPITVISQIAAFVAMTTLGFLVGTISRNVLVPLTVAVAVWVVGFVPCAAGEYMNGVSFLAPFPLWTEFSPPIGWEDIPSISLARTALFVLVVIVGAGSAGQVIDGKPTGRATLAMFLPLTLGIGFVAAQPELVRTSTAPPVCSKDGMVCVSADAAGALTTVDEATRTVTDRFGFGLLTDAPAFHHQVNVDDEGLTRRQVLIDTASAIASGPCKISSNTTDALRVLDTIVARVLGEGSDATTLTDQEIAHWLRNNTTAIATCAPTSPTVP